MTTDGGGWTVFQKRFDGSVDFYRTWDEYRKGFGKLKGEFWLGNKKIHILTSEGTHTLRIDLKGQSGTWKHAVYDEFSISDNSTGYTLSAKNYHGDAGDSLTLHVGRMFETKDLGKRCPLFSKGAWWYNECYYSNLNGLYNNTAGWNHEGVNWVYFPNHTAEHPMKETEMKMKRV